jgi:hypothetical protein
MISIAGLAMIAMVGPAFVAASPANAVAHVSEISSDPVDNSPAKMAAIAGQQQKNFTPTPVALVAGSPGKNPNVTGSNSNIDGFRSQTITPHNGSKGSWDMGFNSTYTTQESFSVVGWKVSGSSYSEWLGSSPGSASSVSLTDDIWVAGVGVSVNVGSGGGASLSISNNVVTLTSSYGPTWQIEHNFSNVAFSTGIAMTGPYENLHSTADFTYQEFDSGIN